MKSSSLCEPRFCRSTIRFTRGDYRPAFHGGRKAIRLTATLAFVLTSFLSGLVQAQAPIDLSGRWTVALDPEDQGISKNWHVGFAGTAIELPGICTEVGLGSPLNIPRKLEKEIFRHPHQVRRYQGAAWYQRDFEVDENVPLDEAELSLERVLWKSQAWINGVSLGEQRSLSSAHLFSTGQSLRVGKNRIVICIDNREQVPLGTLSHAYTEQTQTIWNGVLGRIELTPRGKCHVERLRVIPDVRDGVVSVSIDTINRSDKPISLEATLSLRSVDELAPVSKLELTLKVPAGKHTLVAKLPADRVKRWSEFSPHRYEVLCEANQQRVLLTTGFRSLQAKDSSILINDQPSFMRGTLDCCIFAKTGYPPTDIESWKYRFKIAQAYGLNHIRFHSWCPPEAAFLAADQLGVYLQIELPNWTNDMGKHESVSRFFESEGARIFHAYAHHPSFMFFSLGNELKGDFQLIDQLLLGFQSKANHILMTSTSYSFSDRGHTPGPHDQFFVTQGTRSGWIRGQGFFNQDKPNTQGDFQSGISQIECPVISHEIGQYSVYPNIDEIEKFDGNLRSLALESIRSNLAFKNRLADAKPATENSGKLAVLLYKEEIERAIRTSGQDGFQLLSLTDFPGQSTATVGILDAFWDSKGFIKPEQFRDFCGPTVPLLRIEKRCFQSSETLKAKIQVSHFGEHALQNTDWQVDIKCQDETLFKKDWQAINVGFGNAIEIGEIEFSLDQILQPCQLTVSVACTNHPIKNQWSVWVYPDVEPKQGDVQVCEQVDLEMLTTLEQGGSVLLLPRKESIRNPIDGRFVPVFWSPLHFPDQPSTHGTIIENDHPMFKNFPTDAHTNWQWWELLAKSTSIDLSSISTGRSNPTMRFIDKFNRNAVPAILWEAKVGRGRLLVCSLDIQTDLDSRPVAKALRCSIVDYMNRDEFKPDDLLSKDELLELFK